ncbi:MAG TPA: DinB family protein [Anaerolineales bacterium]|nr:DinB family protein [Anaerolineales bacterium]
MVGELGHIRRRLAEEGEKTLTFFETLAPSDWEQQVYTVGSQWRVRQVLAHFISAERAYQGYIRDVLQGGQGAPRDMDIDAFNDAEAPTLSVNPIAELISALRQARADTISLTETLEESDLARNGYHPWFGEKNLAWYLKMLYRHHTMHLQDVRKSLDTGETIPHSDVHRTGRQVSPPSPAALADE